MADLKSCGAICYVRDGKKMLFLVLRSAKHGGWGAPKGHAEPGETEIETAVRELFEETGVRHVDFAPDFRETIEYEVVKKGERHSKEAVYFLCSINPDELRLSHEHSELHLGPIEEIEMLVPHLAMQEIFRKALERLKQG